MRAAYPSTDVQLIEAAERTNRWAERCLGHERAEGQLVFGIVQGGVIPELRASCAQTLGALPFDGFGIGGLSVGGPRAQTWPALEAACGALPPPPRYLMGVGAPDDLLEAVGRGIDMFDCVLPTRLGRHGAALVASGQMDLRKRALAGREGPLDEGCDCIACARFSIGYLHHGSGPTRTWRSLVSLHNIRFLVRLMEGARVAILNGTFQEYRETHLRELRTGEYSNSVSRGATPVEQLPSGTATCPWVASSGSSSVSPS